MKAELEGYNESVEVGQYREVNKGSLKAFFSLVEYPTGRKTLDCRYFVNGQNRWIAFPQKEVKRDNAKPDYIPIVSYGDKKYEKALKDAILKALEGTDAQATPNTRDEDSTQGESPFVF